MTNFVMGFDDGGEQGRSGHPTNLRRLFDQLDGSQPAEQVAWYDSGLDNAAPARNGAACDRARDSVVEAYLFLVDWWLPGDRIFLFGVGRGAYCARALTRLLNTVGVLGEGAEDLVDYVLATYALPRTHRTAADWERLALVASALTGESAPDVAVEVSFLGLWDTTKVPGLPKLSTETDTDALANVVAGRHAVAIDQPRSPLGEFLMSPVTATHIEEVWFRGTHADIAGGFGSRDELAALTLDWMVDGARQSGVLLCPDVVVKTAAPDELGAAAQGRRSLATWLLAAVPYRVVPNGSLLHSSVDLHLRSHPEYWNRLPADLIWTDIEWSARDERLVSPAVATELVAEPQELQEALSA